MMKVYEFMVEYEEALELIGDATGKEVYKYYVDEELQYTIVQVTTSKPCETIRKIDSSYTVFKPADYFETGKSSYTGIEIYSAEFWEEVK